MLLEVSYQTGILFDLVWFMLTKQVSYQQPSQPPPIDKRRRLGMMSQVGGYRILLTVFSLFP